MTGNRGKKTSATQIAEARFFLDRYAMRTMPNTIAAACNQKVKFGTNCK